MEVRTRIAGIQLSPDRLRYEFSVRGKSAEDISKASGVPAPTLSRIMHGQSAKESTVRAIVAALRSIPIDQEIAALVAKPVGDSQ